MLFSPMALAIAVAGCARVQSSLVLAACSTGRKAGDQPES
jgi:hypothetical protein